MPSAQVITGALTLAQNALKRVQGQSPPGPPIVPDQLTALKVIVDLSGQIQALGNTILAGTPGVPGAGP